MGKIMNIAIDASRLTNNEKTGIEEYSRQIICRLIENDYSRFVLYAKTNRSKYISNAKNITWKKINFPFLWSQVGLTLALLFNKFDIIFIPSHVIPFFGKGKFVVTIHDLAFIHHPEVYSKFALFYHKFAIKVAILKAYKIIVPTQNTKNDLIKYYNYPEDKIAVVYHGYDRKRFNLKNASNNLPFGIRKPYFLYAGRIESKKNIELLVKAFGMLKQEAGINHQLVLVGKDGFGYSNIKLEVEKLPPNIGKDVIETGYISDKTYEIIMKSSDIFIFPSLFEGFGLPILEAMACRIPVVASDSPALKEITDDNALLFNPYQPLSLAAKLSKLIHYPYYREELAMKGWLYSKRFNWDNSAKLTYKVLSENGK